MSELTDYQKLINEQADKNNAWSAEQAQKQMDFQMMMSDTAHQREVADLKAAGLNPVLSASGGSGAAAGSGAMGETDTASTSALASIASTLAQTENAKAIASMRLAQSSLIQSQNYSRNPWLSLLQDVVEDRTGKPLVQTINQGIDWLLGKLGLNSGKSVGSGLFSGSLGLVHNTGSVAKAGSYWNLGTSGWSNQARSLGSSSSKSKSKGNGGR